MSTLNVFFPGKRSSQGLGERDDDPISSLLSILAHKVLALRRTECPVFCGELKKKGELTETESSVEGKEKLYHSQMHSQQNKN